MHLDEALRITESALAFVKTEIIRLRAELSGGTLNRVATSYLYANAFRAFFAACKINEFPEVGVSHAYDMDDKPPFGAVAWIQGGFWVETGPVSRYEFELLIRGDTDHAAAVILLRRGITYDKIKYGIVAVHGMDTRS